MLEKDIEKAVCAHAKNVHGCLVYKFTSPQRRSVPDRIIIFPNGILIFIEFKAPGKRPTEGQAREIERLHGHGQRAYVIDDVMMGKSTIDSVAWKNQI